jgi:K+/H+ antiporter YhaU regulatory subunit KhtT
MVAGHRRGGTIPGVTGSRMRVCLAIGTGSGCAVHGGGHPPSCFAPWGWSEEDAMVEVNVQAERLPAIGWRYTMRADHDRQLTVVTEDSGPVHLVLADPRLDERVTTVRLPTGHAAVLAALLTGARFRLESPDDVARPATRGPTEVVVETVRVTEGSKAIGLPPADLVARLGGDTALLGVISDATPQLVETDERRGVEVGDRLVVAARRGRLDELRGWI